MLICAPPGAGKSAFILSYALKGKIATLYVSADSGHVVQSSRSASILTGRPLEETVLMVKAQRYNGATAAVAACPIEFEYESNPTLDDIKDALRCWHQKYGDFPEMLVVDNITNVLTTQSIEDPFNGLEMLMDELHKIARETGSCVVGLHHVTGSYTDSDKLIPMSGIKQQIGRVPEMILTMYRYSPGFGPDKLRVSTVKNRNGKSDPSGRLYVELDFEGETMQISDKT